MIDLRKFYKNKIILVTGGAGSIGSEIVRKILDYDPSVIRILDNNETGLFDLEQELQSEKIRIFVGDVRNKERLKRAVEDVDIVFHAAALKHVPLCEYNPFEAVKTNAIGTQNLIEVSIDEEVEKFITISTDKAVNPINVMGATKLLAERLTISANFYKGERKTAFSCVRFGNVLNSRGSIIPLFKKQIKGGGPVTITDKNMTRFIMSTSKAVELVLKATKMADGGEIYIFKMPALRIMDLAEVMIEELAPSYGYKPDEIKMKMTGIRPGEKMYESLMTEEEANRSHDKRDMFVLVPDAIKSGIDHKEYNSGNIELLTKEEIKGLLYREGIL